MKNTALHSAIGEIREDYILEAAPEQGRGGKRRVNRRMVMVRRASLAAAACLVLLVGVRTYQVTRRDPEMKDAVSGDAAVNQAADEDNAALMEAAREADMEAAMDMDAAQEADMEAVMEMDAAPDSVNAAGSPGITQSVEGQEARAQQMAEDIAEDPDSAEGFALAIEMETETETETEF